MNVEEALGRVGGGSAGLPRAWFAIQQWLGRRPVLFYALMGLRHGPHSSFVGEHTELVIEGFPRSGNTFAVAAFELAQRRSVGVAHHTHAPAQVITAVRRGLPTLILIREPRDAVLSLLIRRPALTPLQAFRSWVDFYIRVEPLAERFVVGTFEEATSAFGSVTDRVNIRFNTAFRHFESTEANLRACRELIERMDRQDRERGKLNEFTVARPSAEREALKEVLRAGLLERVSSDVVQEADAIYRRFLGLDRDS